LSAFLAWLPEARRGLFRPEDYQPPPLSEDSPAIPVQGDAGARATQLLVLMNKYIRYYLRKAFQGSPLNNPDDFGFLASLIFYGDMQKSELIQRNTGELTSGMEVIRRLEQAGLLRSFPDPNDGRARRLAVTDAGIEAFAAVMPAMQQIGKLALADLSETEQQVLLDLLQRLHSFHQPLFFDTKKLNWEELLRRVSD